MPKIQKDHQTFVSNKPRPRAGMYAIGSSYLFGASSIADADDRP
jgi:hypothetical protein